MESPKDDPPTKILDRRASEIKAPAIPSARYMFAFMYFTGCITIYLMRANLSVAIVCMNSDKEDVTLSNTSSSMDNASYNAVTPELTNEEQETAEFQWSRMLRGLILSGFAIGYIVGQPPCGWLTTKVGGKWLMFTGISIMTLLTFLSPVAARATPYLLLCVQILKGLSCSVFYTSASYLLSYWAPPHELNKLTVFGMAGSLWGTIISFSLSGVLCEYGFDGGWPSVFYVYGIIGVVWLLAWLYFVYDSPALHPRISDLERKYIENSLKGSNVKTPPVPWKSLLTSFPFYAIMMVDFTYAWGWYTVLTSLPQYMKDIFEFSIKKNGVLSSVPYFTSWVFAMATAVLADYIIKRGLLRVVIVRKLAVSVGMILPGIFLLASGFLRQGQAVLGVTFMCISMAGLGVIRSGHYPNMLDIAPRYSGLLMGISNSNVASFAAPAVNGYLVPTGSRREWLNVFIVTAVLYGVGIIFYIIFAQGHVQPWAIVSDENCNESKGELHEKENENTNNTPVTNEKDKEHSETPFI